MELFIDGYHADTDFLTDAHITVSFASVTHPEEGRVGYSKSMSMPMTAVNRQLMGDCEQINACEKFNAKMHEARLEVDGCVVMEGFLKLAGCEKEVHEGRYVFNIVGSSKQWVDYAARTTFSSLFPEYSTTISQAQIKNSWTAATLVRWLPVARNGYEPGAGSVSIQGPERAMSASDYHPFVHCRTLLHRIFSDAGYSIVSDFIDSSYFDSFHMSGRYTTHDVETIRRRMDFKAARFEEVSATANSNGIVYANPNTNYNTIGNIVDTANPDEIRNGKTISGVFDNGGCFVKNGSRVCYVPQYGIKAGFEYNLRYVTTYRIKNREQLCGFDKIYLGDGQTLQLRISNRFEDRRTQFRAGKEFRCMIFDYTAGYVYRLSANKVSSPTQLYTIAQFTNPSAIVSVQGSDTYTNVTLMYALAGSSNFSVFTGQWALYDGYVEERGEVEVEVIVRGKASNITPSSPKYFDTIYFAGAESGMKLKLLKAEVRPIFHMQPTEGDMVSFYDIGVHNINCLSVIKSIGEMFGLCFYTDELEKKVFIEPRDMFYRDDTVVDWSDNLDLSKPLEISEILSEVPGQMTWKYRDGDRATTDFNSENEDTFGALTVDTGNVWQEWDEKVIENHLFSTTINSVGVIASALSASVPNVGDTWKMTSSSVDDLNFTPKIVRYLGMKLLPAGEVWGWPSFETKYPLLAFHYPYPVVGVTKPLSPSGSAVSSLDDELAKGFTLCYEDRDGVAGIHRWWDEVLNTYSSGLRLKAWISISPEDIETFFRPNYLKRDFRARFRLHIEGEWSDWRLEEICDYTPSDSSTKCVFTKII